MTEPVSTTGVGLVVLATAVLGPAAGEYAVIVLSALAGSLWALSKLQTASRAAGALLMLRLMLTAAALTGVAAWWIEETYQIPAHQMLAPIAFSIAALGDRWGPMLDAVGARLTRMIGGAQ